MVECIVVLKVSKIIKSSIQVGILLLLIFSIFHTISIDLQIPESNSVLASSTIVQDKKPELDKGFLTNVSVTSEGKMRLAYIEKFVEDDFLNCSKISYKQGVKRIASSNKIELIKNITFEHTFGNIHRNEGFSCDLTNDGGYIIGGDTWNGNNHVYDGWLIKLDKYGNQQWQKKYNASRSDGLHSVQQTSDGGYIFTGRLDRNDTYERDVWLVKTDALGKLVWERTFGDGDWELGLTVRQTTDGGYIICALNEDYNRIWVIKTNATGILEWERLFEEHTNWFNRNAIQQTTDGGYILVGEYGDLIKLNTSGNVTWSKKIDIDTHFSTYSVIQTSDGGYAVAGHKRTPLYDKDVGLLIRFNDTGVELWNRTYYRYYLTHFHNIFSLNQTKDGGFILVGSSPDDEKNGQDLWFVKTDSNGFEEWNTTTVGRLNDAGYSVMQTNDGGYIATGKGAVGSFDVDFLVVKADSSGRVNPIEGNFSSINLLHDRVSCLIDRFYYDAYIPSESYITIQFSQDKQNWSNSSGILNGTDKLKHGGNSIDLSGLNWHGSNFYYRVNFSSNNTVQDVPSLKNIKIYYNEYFTYGEYKSQIFYETRNVSWISLYWEADIPIKTEIKLQARSADSEPELLLEDFVGPEGSKNQFYRNPNEPFGYTHKSSNWFQYIIYFSSNTSVLTPMIYNIRIIYNYIPTQPTIIEPSNNSILNYTTPTFKWIFNDLDSSQDYVSWQLADSPDFNSIDIDMTIKTPNTKFYHEDQIQDGVWYWRIKILDTDGDWSPYCAAQKLIIDTKIGSPNYLEIFPGDKISQDSFTIKWINPLDVSGIAGAYYKLDSPPKSDTDGTYIADDGINSLPGIALRTQGKHTVYVWLKDKAGNVDFHKYVSADFIYDSTSPPAPLTVQVTPENWTSTNSFNIDWEMPEDFSGIKSGAYYYIGDSLPTSKIEGTWTEEKPFKITDSEEGQSTIYLWLEDEAGNSNHLINNKGVLKLDHTPPKISHTPVYNSTEEREIIMTAEASDTLSGISKVWLFYKMPTQNRYLESEMVKSGNIYIATIPRDHVTPDGLEYYLKSTDNSLPGNTKYFGKNGLTITEPVSTTDIDIEIAEDRSITWKYVEITDHSPTGTNIPIHTNITVLFNTKMSEHSVESAFSIVPEETGEFYWNENKLLFDPYEPLVYGLNYTVTISKTAKSLKGFNLDVGYSWTFTTEREEKQDDHKEKSKSEDQSSIFGLIIGVILFIIIMIILFLILRKKKTIDTKPKETENTEAEQSAPMPYQHQHQHQPQTQAQAQVQTQFQLQTPKPNSCPNCGATISNPFFCPSCGWSHQV